MRGSAPQPPRRAVSPRPSAGLLLLSLACVPLSTAFLSGCASVSAGNSALHAANVSVVPSSVDFKGVVIGQKNSQTLSITNIGNHPLDLNGIHVSGMNFSLAASKFPSVLAPGASTSVGVVFAPAATAAESGALVLYSPEISAPLRVPLTGSGEKPAPALQVAPTTVAFGSHAANSSSFESVRLTNTGNVPLKISSIGLSNSAFSVSGLSTGVSLAPNQHLDFQVWFHPTSNGSWSTNLSVASSSLASPVKLSVSGSASDTAVSSPSAASSHSVNLAWNASSSSVSAYHVYRSDSSGGPYLRVNGSSSTALSYRDSSVQPGARYFYVVTAVESTGAESAFSNEVSAEIPN